jgi:hypothetical protein
LYNFSAREFGELSFMKGDLMYIINNDGDWWHARTKDGKEEGFIPNNYVAEYRSGLHAKK